MKYSIRWLEIAACTIVKFEDERMTYCHASEKCIKCIISIKQFFVVRCCLKNTPSSMTQWHKTVTTLDPACSENEDVAPEGSMALLMLAWLRSNLVDQGVIEQSLNNKTQLYCSDALQ